MICKEERERRPFGRQNNHSINFAQSAITTATRLPTIARPIHSPSFLLTPPSPLPVPTVQSSPRSPPYPSQTVAPPASASPHPARCGNPSRIGVPVCRFSCCVLRICRAMLACSCSFVIPRPPNLYCAPSTPHKRSRLSIGRIVSSPCQSFQRYDPF